MRQRICVGRILAGVLFLSLLFVPVLFPARASQAGPASAPIPLELERPLEPRLNATESHTLTVDLQAGFCGVVVFEWRGMDFEVTVRAPDRSTVYPTSIPIRASGSLLVTMIAEAGGNYTLEVRAVDQLNYQGS